MFGCNIFLKTIVILLFSFFRPTVNQKTQNRGKGRLKCAITIVLQCNEMKIMSNKSTKYVSRQSKKELLLVVIVVENVKKIYKTSSRP